MLMELELENLLMGINFKKFLLLYALLKIQSSGKNVGWRTRLIRLLLKKFMEKFSSIDLLNLLVWDEHESAKIISSKISIKNFGKQSEIPQKKASIINPFAAYIRTNKINANGREVFPPLTWH
jgi:hypothetical protein